MGNLWILRLRIPLKGNKIYMIFIFSTNHLKLLKNIRYHPDYSNNRVWRVFSLVNPSAELPMITDANADDYPFSMPVEKLLTLNDVISFNRDQYEGERSV